MSFIPFQYTTRICNILYEYHNENSDYKIVEIKDLVQTINICKNINHYIKLYEEYIKDTVIRKLKNLNLVQTIFCVFDNNNILHRLSVSVIKMLDKLINDNEKIKINLYKSIICIVLYEGKINFIGNLNFDALI
jgi:hypothetical protein